MAVKIGCCGFPVARQRYFKQFTVVEVQQTFYQLPILSTAHKWREEAPDGFEFTAKAWQLITHEPTSPTYRRLKTTIAEDKRKNYGSFKPTDEVFEAFEATAQFCRDLGAEKLIFQCPPSFHMTSQHVSNIMDFFGQIKGKDFTIIWEPRGNWDEEEIRAICRELGLVHCVDPFRVVPVSGGVRYFRLHGLKGYRYRYTDEDLRELKAKWSVGEAIYFMFNNISMMEDAHRFEELLRSGS
jgi:uncharacterized protein YecE (DUF72 family)